jgi:hypothetical protein
MISCLNQHPMTVMAPDKTKQYFKPFFSRRLMTTKFIGTNPIRNIKVVIESTMEWASYILVTINETELNATIQKALPMRDVE